MQVSVDELLYEVAVKMGPVLSWMEDVIGADEFWCGAEDTLAEALEVVIGGEMIPLEGELIDSVEVDTEEYEGGV